MAEQDYDEFHYYQRICSGILALTFILLFGGLLSETYRGTFENLLPHILTASIILIIIPIILAGNLRLVIWLVTTVLIIFFIEYFKVTQTELFDNQQYSRLLGISIAGVPVLSVILGAFVLAGLIALVSKLEVSSRFLGVLIVLILALLFGYIFEPAALRLGIFSRTGSSIPMVSFAVYGAAALISALIFELLRVNNSNRLLLMSLSIILWFSSLGVLVLF